MSTRCQVSIEGSPVLIYKHSDGYPEGVLPTLTPFVRSFFAVRGNDPSYLAARCLAALVAESDKARTARARKCTAEERKRYGYDKPDCLGFGLDTDLHGDIEYFYTIRTSGAIEVRHRGYDERGYDEGWSLEQTIPLHPAAPSCCDAPGVCTRKATRGTTRCRLHVVK